MLRKFAVAVAGSGLAMVVAGCSALPGAAGGASVTEVLSNLVSQTREVESYRAEMTTSGSMQGQATEMTQEITYSGTPEPTYEITMDLGTSGTSRVLMRGDEILVEGDPSMGGPAWLRSSAAEGTQQPQDPMAELEKLLAGEGIEEAGSEEVNGVSTTKYTGTYSVDQALENIDDADAKESAQQLYSQSGVSEMAFEVWVDDEGLPRRVSSEAGDFTSTMDFLEFNQPVEIEYPSADQIGDMDDLMGDLGDMGDMN
ncbi:hypothetical protein HDA32_004981 [Spinactinospora alkalitolerans]|uniref:LppX_LprAFG lipoprotein n=1 Tax=Spinactinospora alkalitolerans TaxID=687207 RepID=A0A852U164_9ACTN|nr:hypothetical protein [Spinactinospora alkalitolerans]NYE49861.1 hypothetical protein [Spinactinospora alkalitolerans]